MQLINSSVIIIQLITDAIIDIVIYEISQEPKRLHIY